MIADSARQAFNTRLRITIADVRGLSPSAADRVVQAGTRAENLRANADFAHAVHEARFEIMDELAAIATYNEHDNQRRIALSHELRGLDRLVSVLDRACYLKNRVVTEREQGAHAGPKRANSHQEIL